MYKDLQVYQRSYKLAISLYKFAVTMPKDEQYGLTSQIKRAATSIPLNIAEGYGKNDTKTEVKRFLKMAKGSCNEMKVITDFCKDLGYIGLKAHGELKSSYEEIGKMLHGLISRWK